MKDPYCSSHGFAMTEPDSHDVTMPNFTPHDVTVTIGPDGILSNVTIGDDGIINMEAVEIPTLNDSDVITLSKKIPCTAEGCTATYSHKYSLSRHVRKKHPELSTTDPAVHACIVCDKVFRDKCGLQHHILVKHQGGSFPCTTCPSGICNKKFQTKSRSSGTHPFLNKVYIDICVIIVQRGFNTEPSLKRMWLSIQG